MSWLAPALALAAGLGEDARWCALGALGAGTHPAPWWRCRPGRMPAAPAGMTCRQQDEEDPEVDVENLLAKAADNLSVRRAFGAAYEKNGMLIIPVAIVAGGGGGGTAPARRGNPAADPGSPPGQGAAAPWAAPQDSGRTEAGGGFGGLVLPSGAYVVRGDQVRWVPAVDVTIAVLASLSLVRVLSRAWARQRGHRRRS